ncbi:SPFH domain-containing protein [Massilia sp. TS11]|uniref:SPFH domain-containing protein n=1 Tax=Massilia sp. TS11 TaxID=2908003 RepID=UPI001EDB9A65|nr:SPFH domain-containing protein [Massilia sp. TS11]MCG2586059.1 SPFH domain-containing protein [Massilia sp. TS11]
MQVSQEQHVSSASGYAVVFGSIVFAAIGLSLLLAGPGPLKLFGFLCIIATLFGFGGLYMIQPNQAVVLTLFGAYRGTVRDSGLRWSNAFYAKRKVSLRANNLNMDRLKVNDKRGNPVEIAAAVVWQVADTARASFDVEDYYTFIKVQAEAALRHVTTQFNYDHSGHDQDELTLMNGGDKILALLVETLQSRTEQAGLRVLEARLTHLAYAPEIAGVMLRRQQAEAVIAARQRIVEGAVSMVEMALRSLSEKQVVELDDERRAAMVGNLLVVLCAEREVEPVINSGTLYH